MELLKDKVYTLPVKRIEEFNGRRNCIVEFESKEYRVKLYPNQNNQRDQLRCVYVGNTTFGIPQFEQLYRDVLGETYLVDGIYQFRISQECIDQNTGAFYYKLSDEYGFYHRVYMPHNSIYKQGDTVDAIVREITDYYMSVEILPRPQAQAKYSLGDVINLKSVIDPDTLDFSRINPGRDTTLRDYQVENKRKIYEAWQHCRSVMLQMPTGTGKTRLFVSIARDIFDYSSTIKRTLRVLILAHRKELIAQISEHLGQKYRLAHGLIMSQNIEQPQYTMQVGSVPTLTRRLKRWEGKKFDVIIIDEAHHVKAKSYKRIIDLFPDAKILGVTATPYRLNHAGFRPEFDELIVSPSVAEFIKRNYLCEYDYYSIRPNSELQKEIDRMKLDFEGDYKESEMMEVMDRDFIRADILDAYLKYAKDKKGIVYTISRSHNIHLAEKFKEAGIVSAAIDSETPKEKRDEMVVKFRRGDIQVLFNVNIFSEGFDCPDVEVIQLARPTKSLSMYLQQVGRGLRPAEGKERLIILDNVGLYNKFGFPSARRKWRYHFEGQEVDESPSAQTRERDEEREVKDIFEGKEAVAMLHSSVNEEVSTSALDSINRNYKDNFISYASQDLGKSTVQGYVRTIENPLDDYIRAYLVPDFKSIFNTVDVNELKAIREKLSKRQSFVSLNDEKHHIFSAAFNKYINFAMWFDEHHDDLPSLPDIELIDNSQFETINYLEPFQLFLERDQYSPAGVKQAVDTLTKVIDEQLRLIVDGKHVSVFRTVDTSELESYYEALKQNHAFIYINKMKGSLPSSTLKKYIDFAKDFIINPSNYHEEEREKLVQEETDSYDSSSKNTVASAEDSEPTLEGINIAIKDLDSLSGLLKKNNLHVDPQVEEKRKQLAKKKASLLRVDSIIVPIREYLNREGLLSEIIFRYEGASRKVDILAPTFDPFLKQRMDEIDQIESLMQRKSYLFRKKFFPENHIYSISGTKSAR